MARHMRVGVGAAVLTVVAAAAGGPAWADEPAPSLRIGMVQGMFRDVQPALVQALSRPLREMIRRETGVTGDVDLAPDGFTLADRMEAGRYQLGVFHGFEFAWAKARHPDLVPLVVTVPPGRRFQACVVVHRESKASTLADLADTVVTVPRGTKAHCLLFLDRRRAGLPATTARPQAKSVLTGEEALDAVVSGDAPAALVDVAVLNGYRTIQPGAVQHLRVLCQSDPFPPTVIAYVKGAVPAETAEQVRRLLTQAHTTAAGKPLLMLWNLKGFEDPPADYPAQLEKVLKAYPPPAGPSVAPVENRLVPVEK